MKTKPQPVDRSTFIFFSESEWQSVVAETAVPFSLDPIKCDVEFCLSEYAKSREFSIGHEIISDSYEGDEIPENLQWFRYDLEAGHRRLAAAAREMIAAYESHLHPDWHADDEQIEKRAGIEFDLIHDKLAAIAEYSDVQAASIKAEKQKYREDIADFYGRSLRGRQSNTDRQMMVWSLIGMWRFAGGSTGAGKSGDKGGPLVRFLIAVTSPVFKSRQTVAAVQHWIRTYRIEEREDAAEKKRWMASRKVASRTGKVLPPPARARKKQRAE